MGLNDKRISHLTLSLHILKPSSSTFTTRRGKFVTSINWLNPSFLFNAGIRFRPLTRICFVLFCFVLADASVYTVSGPRDHYREQSRAGGYVLEKCPEYPNMFSQVVSYPSQTYRYARLFFFTHAISSFVTLLIRLGNPSLADKSKPSANHDHTHFMAQLVKRAPRDNACDVDCESWRHSYRIFRGVTKKKTCWVGACFTNWVILC